MRVSVYVCVCACVTVCVYIGESNSHGGNVVSWDSIGGVTNQKACLPHGSAEGEHDALEFIIYYYTYIHISAYN